jgi:ubiquinone/menaquinone biosynthesis C-methylase UbiE
MDSEKSHSDRAHRSHGTHFTGHAADFLLSPERRQWQDPVKIVEAAGIMPGWKVLDVGSGPCYFDFQIAWKVGDSGAVYAMDASQELLSRCMEMLKTKGAANLHPILSDAEMDWPIRPHSVNAVFMANVLHDFSSPSHVISQAERVLSRDGLLINIDWKKEETGFGPPVMIRFSPEQVINLVEQSSFRLERRFDAGPFHYGFVFARK